MAESTRRTPGFDEQGNLDVSANGLKSRVQLEADGADKSALQIETSARVNIELADRYQKMEQNVRNAIDSIRNSKLPIVEAKKVFPALIKAAKGEIDKLQADNPELAEELYAEMAMAITENVNIKNWAEEVTPARAA